MWARWECGTAWSRGLPRSTLLSVSTVWKPCGSTMRHCVRVFTSGSKYSVMREVPPRVGLVLEVEAHGIRLVGDARDGDVAAEIDLFAQQELQRRLLDEVHVLRRKLPVAHRHRRAVGDDLQRRGRIVIEPQLAGALEIERSAEAASVAADLREIGLQRRNPGEIGVRAVDDLAVRELLDLGDRHRPAAAVTMGLGAISTGPFGRASDDSAVWESARLERGLADGPRRSGAKAGCASSISRIARLRERFPKPPPARARAAAGRNLAVGRGAAERLKPSARTRWWRVPGLSWAAGTDPSARL